MFKAIRSSTMDTGYIPSSRAPFQYSGSRGPGTLEMITLNARHFGARPVSRLRPVGAMLNAVKFRISSGLICAKRFFASRTEACTTRRRLAGSQMCVPRLAKIIAIWLPPALSSLRRDIGTMAISGRSGRAFWLIRYSRSACPHMLSTTSLRVQLKAPDKRLRRSSE